GPENGRPHRHGKGRGRGLRSPSQGRCCGPGPGPRREQTTGAGREAMRIQAVRVWAARRRRFIPLVCLILAAVVAPVARAADDQLILGIFPRLNASETTTRYAPLAEYLGQKLGRKVTIVTSKDFQSFWQGIEEQRYDIVQYNQYHYIRSSRNY